MSSLYRFVPAEADDSWNDFVESSDNGTIFSHSAYLSAISGRVKRYYCLKNQEPRAALAIIESREGDRVIQDDLFIYNGMMFSPDIGRMNHAKQHSERFRITEFAATELAAAYRQVHLTFHPTVTDIRPFLWVNYGTDLPKFVPDIRYTSYLDLSGFASDVSWENTDLFHKASPSRRQEIRYAAGKQVTTVETFDVEKFLQYYHMTMTRQSVAVPQDHLQKMRGIMENLRNRGMGRMFTAYNQSGEAGSMAFFGVDSKRGYYLFGANHPEMRDQHCGTQVLWEALRVLSRDGIQTVDLEGVNSPNRGWFKLSFGGTLVPYFSVQYSAAGAPTPAETIKETVSR